MKSFPCCHAADIRKTIIFYLIFLLYRTSSKSASKKRRSGHWPLQKGLERKAPMRTCIITSLRNAITKRENVMMVFPAATITQGESGNHFPE